MKKVLLGLGLLIVLLLGTLAVLPVLFKDKIKVLLDHQIARQVKADVHYETENVNLTVFRSFPNLTLAIDELAIIGQDTFARDTLAYLPSLELNLDIMSVISGNEVKVKSVTLQRPFINLIVTKHGTPNWDIMRETPAETDTLPATESDMKLALEGWKINDGKIIYTDNTLPFVADLRGVNHNGSGDFEKNIFDMESHTDAERFTMKYGGVPYISKAKLNADVTMGMDLDKMLYTFKENKVKLNDFVMGFDGSIAMPTEDILLDLTFNAKDATFKSLLSVVPGMYADNFDNVKTEGKMSFQGFLKGVSSETSTPGYGIDLQVADAMFQYPDLPQAARNINIDMSVKNPDGQDQSMAVDVRRFHLDLGNNPVDAVVKITGLDPMLVDGNVKAKVNLHEITQVVPVEGMTLRGLLNVDATAKGTYSETQMPVTQAILALTDGYVKSADFPAPIEQLTVNGVINNATGQMNDTRVNIERFRMLLDGEPLEGRVSVIGLDKSQIDADIKGVLDLTKLTKIFPLEDMTVAGRINADVKANFNMADIEAERYTNVKVSGNSQINNLTFVSKDLPQGMKINRADMTFNNEQLLVKEMAGSLGKSDFNANGTLSNYMGYALEENQSLKGNLSVNSNRFDVNEWMVEEPAGTPAVQVNNPDAGTVKSETEGVVPVPANIDLVLNASAATVLYDNLTLENMKGQVIIKDQIARLQNVSFNTLGGSFTTSGSYNTQDLAHPKFTFDLGIKNLEFKKAYEAFNTVKTFAPITKLIDGTFATNFKFAGDLGQDMMPVFSTLTGGGVVEVVKALVNNVPVLTKLSSLTKLDELKNLAVENEKFDVQILNGNMIVKPFDLKIGDKINMQVGGQNSYTGGIDYLTAIDVPTGKVGAALNQQLSGIKGLNNLSPGERVTMNFNIGGTMSDPKVSLASGSVTGQAKTAVQDAVKNVVKEQTDKAQQQFDAQKAAAEQRAREEADKQRQELERKQQEAEQRAREEVERQRKEAEDRAKKEAEDKLKGIFKR